MSSALGGEGALSQRQVSLLDELAAAIGVGGGAPDEGRANLAEGPALCELHGTDYEAFHRHWRQVRARHRRLEESERRSRWRWIDQVQEICAATCAELDKLLAHLAELDTQRADVVRKTTALHGQCEQMVQDQERLGGAAEALAERLDVFDRVADVARVLDQGNAAASHPDFSSMLDQLDGSTAFLETHGDFCQAQAYLHQFEHLRNRACISIRSALQKSLEKSTAQVEQQLRERAAGEGAVDTQVFYSRFRAAALNYRPLMTLLHRRVDVHEMYGVTLEELEAFYVHLRVRLVSSPVTAHLQSVLHHELQMGQLAPATRQASTYILDISHFECQCFEAYFEVRQAQEALRTLLETVADIFYKILRPVVLACDSIDALREIADCLQMDILEPHQQSQRNDLVPVLAVVFRLHKDVQEKLIFRVQMYIRTEIKGYQVGAGDLDYPAAFFSADSGGAAGEQDGDAPEAHEFKQGWFPTLQRTLAILAKIYRVLEMSTFQGLAQEAVDLCIASLKHAAQLLVQRPLPDRSHVLGPLVQMMDSQLFLVKHLLLLREQVAAFECDLVVNEKYFNFSNVWEALHLKLPDGLLGILKPKMCQSQVDSKKDIEAELKAACETLITHLAAHITQPLAALNTQIGDFLAVSGGDRAKLKDQPFMLPERLRGIIAAFLANVRERVPFAAAHVRLYLGAPGGVAAAGDRGSASQSTASILFMPVQHRLVDTWGRLESLLEEWQLDAAELDGLGFIRPDALRELVASLFSGIMEAPWASLVDVVSQVPRAAATAAAPPAAVPPATEAHATTELSPEAAAAATELPTAAAAVTEPPPAVAAAATEPPPAAASVAAPLHAAAHVEGVAAVAAVPGPAAPTASEATAA